MLCRPSQRTVYSNLMAIVFTRAFLLLSLGPAELTLAPFEVHGNPKIRSDALEWGEQETTESSLRACIFIPFAADYSDFYKK